MTAAEKRLKVRENRKNGNIKELSIGDVASGVLSGIGTASDYVDKSVGIAGTPVNVYNTRKLLKDTALNITGQKDNKWADLGLEFLIPDSSDLLAGAGYASRGADLLQALRIARKTDPSTLRIAKAGLKDIKKATDDFIDGPPTPQPAVAGLSIGQGFKNGGKKATKNGSNGNGLYEKDYDYPIGEQIIDGSKPLQMTADEAATTWGKVTKAPIEELGITGVQKQSDTALSKVVRYVESGRHDKLSPRNQKAIIASQVENSPLKYLVKYSGGSLQKADSHHILDIDFWGRALDTKHNKEVSTVLWKDKVKTGNAGENIVWAWSRKKGSVDHDTLHRLYDSIPIRQEVEALMANGRWQTMTAKAQARMLRNVAYDQHRLTNNFMNMKLNFILRKHPELNDLHPVHLRNKILKHPEKYGEIAVINPKDPNQVKQLLMTLQQAPNTGGVNPKVREVFGLETPKAGAKKYTGSATQKNFDLRIAHRLNKARKLNINK